MDLSEVAAQFQNEVVSWSGYRAGMGIQLRVMGVGQLPAVVPGLQGAATADRLPGKLQTYSSIDSISGGALCSSSRIECFHISTATG